jgi:hypothetical protein
VAFIQAQIIDRFRKEALCMVNEDINRYADKIYAKVGNIPGIDRTFIQKCLLGISSLNDQEVENKIRQLMMFL